MAVTSVDRSSDTFLLDAYAGKGGFLSGKYLVRHGRETDDKYQERQALAEYPNYVRKIVNIYSGFLFQRQPGREASDQYARFAANADGAGTAIDMAMLHYQRLAMLVGTVYLIVDKPAQAARTRADEGSPYLAMRLPGEVTDSKMDAMGRLTRITFVESAGGKPQYRTFTTEGWTLHKEADGSGVIASGRYALGRVPVVRLHSTIPLRATDLRATGWCHDIAQANWSLYNQLSEMRELFRKQTFSILTLPVVDADEAQRLRDLTISTENALTFNPSGGGEPAYIAPPADPVKLYLEAIAKTVERIYELANLEFIGGVHTSGVAMAYQFQQANQSMVDMAMLTERAEIDIAGLVSAWMGEEWSGVIAYPRDFNLSNLAAELKDAMDAETLGISPTFDRELKKRLARRMLGHNVSQATMESIDREIESGADPYGDRIQKEAGLPPTTQTGNP